MDGTGCDGHSQTSNTNNSKINRVGPYSWMGLGDSRKVRRVGPYYPASFLELGGPGNL